MSRIDRALRNALADPIEPVKRPALDLFTGPLRPPMRPLAPTFRDRFEKVVNRVPLILFASSVAAVAAYLILSLMAGGKEASITIETPQPGAAGARLVQSDAVLAAASRLAQAPVSELRAKLTITAIANAPLVRLSYRDRDERRAVEIVNAIAQSYLNTQRTALPANGPGPVKPMSEAYLRAKTERIGKEAEYEAVKIGSTAALLASSRGDSFKKSLAQQAEAQRSYAELKQTYGPNNPRSRRVQTRLRSLEARIEGMRQTIVKEAFEQFREARSREEALAAAYPNAGGSAQIVEPARVVRVEGHAGSCSLLAAIMLGATLMLVAFLGPCEVRLRNADDLQSASGYKALAVIPQVSAWKSSSAPQLLGAKDSQSDQQLRYEKSIESLRGAVETALNAERHRTLLITSALPFERRSTLAANLASAFADAGWRTLLIDGDLRKPALDRLLSGERPGLADALSGQANWMESIVDFSLRPLLHFLPAGVAPSDAQPFDQAAFKSLFDEAQRFYDVVLVDGPPFLRFPEAVDLALSVDSVIVNARANYVSEREFRLVLEYLHRLQARVLGTVYSR